ncbi:leucine-rich repeat-containing protein 40-like [Gigantopelta aegis]|uniref:leucine-rich repeat-containing protein 40-like n=1 Tax=Gigantopelta aegis TaxID=1735272 RepID=UPI001B887687|nr:leucine-rich repeat-containing protein 40-like [Gigantopelta aegis]
MIQPLSSPSRTSKISSSPYRELRSNQLSDLPMTLSSCLKLRDIYLSLNRFTLLPSVIYECIKHLELGGNRFRTPRPAILTKGTAALLEYLRDRISK